MRSKIRGIVNGILAAAHVRMVNTGWGPRGFDAALRRLKAMGVTPGQIVDVGASDGKWTRECMTIFPDARYFLVDPLPENAAPLKALQAAQPRVKFWSGGLGAQPGTLSMKVHGDQSSFLNSEYASGPGQERAVEVRTLDSFLGSDLLDPPAMIKADVQGYELEVLKGAGKCLNTTQLLLLEVSFRRIYAGCPLAHEVISHVASAGFRAYDICSYVQRPRDGELVQADMIFVKDGSPVFSHEGYA
jgi:FkbM family methyltransferase